MANHPYNQHREQQVAHRRVGVVLSSHPAGAQKHNQGAAYSKITSKTAAVNDDEVRGHSSPKRFARGGKVKGHKGHQTNIAIVMPKSPGAPDSPLAAGPTAGPAGGPPMAGPGPLPGGPPGMPPGMPPMPMRKSGGRVIDGESTKVDIKKWGKRAKNNSYFRGGAASGVGREEKAEHMKRKGK